METNKCDSWAQAIVSIAPYFILAMMGPLLVLHTLDPSSHDVVLSIVSGLVGSAVGPHAQTAIASAIKGVMPATATPVSKDSNE